MERHGVRLFDESQQQAFERGYQKGRALARVSSVLIILEVRGISITDEQRALIESCDDFAALDRWLRRAATITTVDELFAD